MQIFPEAPNWFEFSLFHYNTMQRHTTLRRQKWTCGDSLTRNWMNATWEWNMTLGTLNVEPETWDMERGTYNMTLAF